MAPDKHGNVAVQGQLKSANVGDSGFLIVGQGGNGEQLSVRYHSPQQEHSFGCPYQLGHYEGADSPEDAMLMTVPVSYTAASVQSLVRVLSVYSPCTCPCCGLEAWLFIVLFCQSCGHGLSPNHLVLHIERLLVRHVCIAGGGR